MPRETRPSICRFCHANCGILVELEDGRPVRVTGDPDNPAYRGFICARGRRLPEQHAHPDRLLCSRKRIPAKTGSSIPGNDLARAVNDGGTRFEKIGAGVAMDEIAARIGEIVRDHGPRSVALYPGTYAGPHPASIPTSIGWLLALGSRMLFTAASIDQPGKHVANAIHGRWLGGSHVFDESDVWMLVGNNPLISISGGIPPANVGRRLRHAKKRGLKLIVIDPRRTEVARFADIHLQPKPGEDPAILAAMLHVVVREKRHDPEFIEAHCSGFDALSRAVERFTPEFAARRAGIGADEIERAARSFARGPRGCGVAGTGPNMSPHGNLTEYLLLALNTICGRWRREGERVPNPGALLPRAIPKAQASAPRPGWGFGESLASRGLTSSAAGLPTAALADEILHEGKDRIRCLICVGSNPVAAWPDQAKTVRAMERLDLLVCLDPKISATARFADYVIAPKLSLETPGLSISSEALEQTYVAMGYSEPYAQYTPAIADPPPGADVIEEWEFFHGLAKRMGLRLTCRPIRPETGVLRERRHAFELDMDRRPSTDEVLEGLMNGSRIPLDELKRHPHGRIFDEETIRVAPADPDATDRLDVGNADMLAELLGLHDEGSDDRDRPFRLISRRMPNVYNSSARDIAALSKGRNHNPAYLHPEDLAALGLAADDLVDITSDHASIPAIVAPAPELRRGIVSMAHGFGGDPRKPESVLEAGSNTGRLIDNASHFDPHTGIPRMSAIPVSVTPRRG
ncbi:MAG TPA: molybdopterin dinucleotide-binding protein [Deltaproteobacteria bacterium]|nr:molybdopterin dinucleotide-binding protein [Deltaproteobacteria bacterium]